MLTGLNESPGSVYRNKGLHMLIPGLQRSWIAKHRILRRLTGMRHLELSWRGRIQFLEFEHLKVLQDMNVVQPYLEYVSSAALIRTADAETHWPT